ncbi:MAG: hypothetical protein MUO34_03590, partial [Ignavibacteriaceae bacterium]|nr:hypothetical protein [Ignavibacteriaceae bacterium]
MKLITSAKTGIFLLLTMLTITACSNSSETSSGTTSFQSGYGDNSFTFKDNGDKWRADFEDGEIAALYKNGERIPSEEIALYEDLVYDKFNDLRKDLKKLKSDVHVFQFDSERFKDDMKEMKKNLKENLSNLPEIEFDKEFFKKDLMKLKESMKELKDKKIEIHFDNDAFKCDMDKLKKELEDIDFDKINIEIKRNLDNVNKELENVRIQVKDIDVDLSGLDEEMKELNIEMKKLNIFIEEMKNELVKDGYLKNKDEEV